MIQTVYYTNKNFPIPSSLVMEKILNLEEKLEGQSVKIKSIFNKQDSDPSMVIFYSDDEGIYRFKDFSSGNYGDAIDIALELYELPDRQLGYRKILEIFKDDIEIPKHINTIEKETKEIMHYEIRKWSNFDAEFWKQFGISGKFLKAYNIKPISKYVIRQTQGNTHRDMEFDLNLCYGYFDQDNQLYKLYQPNRKKAKFLKVKDHIQGIDQITFNNKCLIIASSIKDIGAFKALKFNSIELVAPDSENTIINQEYITKFKNSYEYVFTMFDNDIAGMKAMKKYEEVYGLPFIYFNVEKDIAECVKQHGIINTKLLFTPIFKNAIKRAKNTQAT